MNAYQPDLAGLFGDPPHDHPSDYILIKYTQKELRPEQRKTLYHHLQDCPTCRQRIEKMSQQKAEFLAGNPFDRLAARPTAQVMAPRTRIKLSPVPSLIAGGIVAVLVIITFVLFLHLRATGPKTGPGIILKGVNITWVVKRGDRQEIADPSFSFESGDRIGFRVLASSPVYAMVISVNRAGDISLRHPGPGQEPILVPAKKRTTLPLSLLLAPPLEHGRIFVIVYRKLLTSKEVITAAGREFARCNAAGKDVSEMITIPIEGHVESRLVEP